jgi:hypothetical protein
VLSGIKGNSSFHRSPEVLDLIEIGRVRRQRQQGTSLLRKNLSQSRHPMKSRIVENDHLSRPQHFHQVLFKPGLDQATVTVSLEGQRGQDLALTPRCGHRNPLRAVSTAFADTPGAFLAPAIGITERIFDTGFIQINPILGGNLC